MRQTHLALAVLTAAVLSACGGSSDGTSPEEQKLNTTFSNLVSFGDSLSDVGSYNVGTIKASGGGKFTINGDNTTVNPALTGKNWTELMATQLGLPAPCAAQTGLDGNAAQGFSVPVVNNPNCFSYAQGGARVINPVGPENKLTGSPLGLLTVPVVQQVTNHLTKTGGKFSGTEVVFVTAGGNDVLALLGELQVRATAEGEAVGAAEGARIGAQVYLSTLISLLAEGATDKQGAAQAIQAAVMAEAARANSTPDSITTVAVGTAAAQGGNQAVGAPEVHIPIVLKARVTGEAAGKTAGEAAGKAAGEAYAAAQAPVLVTAMGTAGAQLAGIVKNMIVANGANYVVVNNLPDLGGSPAGKALETNKLVLVNTMVDTFNAQLKSGLGADAKVLYVDLWSTSHDQIINPGPYGLTVTNAPACTVKSLVCNGTTLKAGDVSHYMFADEVLPTPFENTLIAKYVAQQMIIKGWL